MLLPFMPVGSAAESRMVSTIVEPLVARSFDAAGMNGGGSIFATASWDAGDPWCPAALVLAVMSSA